MSSRRRDKARNPRSSSGRKGDNPVWARYSDDQLLELRFCDLGVKIGGTPLGRRIEQLYDDLEKRHLRFRPHFWLGEEWFSPDGVPGIGLPFYLAHPRLMQLEYRQMFEVEGGTEEWCMRLLRHEAGHAIDTAYRLSRRRRWREVFGSPGKPYPEVYRAKPYSRHYVLHLDWWYAQSHPTEDFAETFAVWLKPGSLWRRQYREWPACRKLEYVEELMEEIAGKKAFVTSRQHVEPLSRVGKTLRQHYEEKRAHYQGDYPEIYDRDLRRLFSDYGVSGKGRSAAAFLRRIRPELRKAVARGTGEHSYTIEQVLNEMIVRCRELNLQLDRPEGQVKLEVAVLLSAQTINYLHSGYHRVPL